MISCYINTETTVAFIDYKLDNIGNKQEKQILVCECDGESLSLTNQMISFPCRWLRE
jgi:hypothetical protein